MTTQVIPNKMRIATTEAGLEKGWFPALRIPPPARLAYVSFAREESASDGSVVRVGRGSLEMFWDAMTTSDLSNIRRVLETLIDQRDPVYLTFDRQSGEQGGEDLVDARAYARTPRIGSAASVVGFGQRVVQSVTITFENVEIVNAPSLYST